MNDNKPDDVAYLLAAVCVVPTIDNGFALAEIDHIEAVCRGLEPGEPWFGYVVALKNGRRLFVSVTAPTPASVAPSGVNVIPMRAEQFLPLIEDRCAPYWYKPDIVNVHLGSLRE